MTDKSIFVYKLFLSLNISDFSSLFLCKNWNPLKKSPCSFPAAPTKRSQGCHFENLVVGSTPSRNGVECTMIYVTNAIQKNVISYKHLVFI